MFASNKNLENVVEKNKRSGFVRMLCTASWVGNKDELSPPGEISFLKSQNVYSSFKQIICCLSNFILVIFLSSLEKKKVYEEFPTVTNRQLICFENLIQKY